LVTNPGGILVQRYCGSPNRHGDILSLNERLAVRFRKPVADAADECRVHGQWSGAGLMETA
jgi:hypothetical protein